MIEKTVLENLYCEKRLSTAEIAARLNLFVRFLREIAGVDESRVNPHIDRRNNPRQQWSPYGIATVRMSSMKLKAWLDQRLDENIGRLMGHPVSSERRAGHGAVREGAATCTYA